MENVNAKNNFSYLRESFYIYKFLRLTKNRANQKFSKQFTKKYVKLLFSKISRFDVELKTVTTNAKKAKGMNTTEVTPIRRIVDVNP